MKRLNFLILFLLSLALLGCAGTSVVSRGAPTQASYRLTAATVVWAEDPSLRYEILATGRGFTPKIEEGERLFAKFMVERMLSVFRPSAAQQLRAQLAIHNVTAAKGVVLEIRPTTANVVVGGGRSLSIRASIKDSTDGKVIWSVVIRAHGPRSDNDGVLVTNFVGALVSELKSAGWLV